MAAKKHPVVDPELCISCGICETACPVSCIFLTEVGLDQWKNLFPKTDLDKCIGCSMCAKACPMGALEMVERQEMKTA